MMPDIKPQISSNQKAGFTLVELLVAIAVISLLAGISLPAVRMTIREQKVKRGASLVQSIIEEARSRAIVSGGAGVIIDRLGSKNLVERSQSIHIRIADVPPPYTGDAGGTLAVFGYNSTVSPVPPTRYALWFHPNATQVQRSRDDILASPSRQPTLINPGDIVMLGSAGLRLRILDFYVGTVALRSTYGIDASVIPDAGIGDWTMVRVVNLEVNNDLSRLQQQPFSFTINRQPRPAIAAPVALPEGISIDLTASGLGRRGNQFSPMEITGNYIVETAAPFINEPDTPPLPNPSDYQSVWIMFNRRGEVSTIYNASLIAGIPTLTEVAVTGDIHLLVGRAGELKVTPSGQLEDDDPNPLADEAKDGTTPLVSADSVWVSIKARTGEVLASPLSSPTIDSYTPPLTSAIQQTRIQNVIGRARNDAIRSRDGGSL